jgi:hypothetical protein
MKNIMLKTQQIATVISNILCFFFISSIFMSSIFFKRQPIILSLAFSSSTLASYTSA